MKRLVTRSDFDGLVCAMLLKEINIIDEIKFVHPKDVQDGKVDITENDITTNLPFDKRVGLAFDHHESELLRNKKDESPAGGSSSLNTCLTKELGAAGPDIPCCMRSRGNLWLHGEVDFVDWGLD